MDNNKLMRETTEYKWREPNYDFLRIISSFTIVMLHVSTRFLKYNEMGIPTNCSFLVMLINHSVRFAVPCFFMLSGAFILSDERNADYNYFYKKSVKNIGITGSIFCLIYLLYNISKLIASTFIFNKHGIDHILPELLTILKRLLTGRPYGHLWYLFTLIGIYLAVPFVVRLVADLHRGGGRLIWKQCNCISCPRKCELYNK